jgi:hypothetical protein
MPHPYVDRLTAPQCRQIVEFLWDSMYVGPFGGERPRIDRDQPFDFSTLEDVATLFFQGNGLVPALGSEDVPVEELPIAEWVV